MNKFRVVLLIVFMGVLFECQQKKEATPVIEEQMTSEEKAKPVEGIVLPDKNEQIAESKRKCQITNEAEQLKETLFPFGFKDFDAAMLKRFFSKNTVIDSTLHKNEEYSYMIYKFKQGSSFVSFFVKPKSGEEPWFYLDYSSIDNNFFTFKNGIKIGTSKADVSRVLGVPQNTCDTLQFQEGDLPGYYAFIFKEEKLVKINITPPTF